jgi:hypothetical protein
VLNRRFTLFNQILIDPSAQRLGLESFLRSYLRYKVFGAPKADLHVEGKDRRPSAASRRAPTRIAVPRELPAHLPLLPSLRSNQLPADNADLLSHRGRARKGSRACRRRQHSCSRGFRWSTIHAGTGVAAWPRSVRPSTAWPSQGTRSTRASREGQQRGKQLRRVAFVPATGILLGLPMPVALPRLRGGALPVGEQVGTSTRRYTASDLEFGIPIGPDAEFAANRWQSPNSAMRAARA